MPLLAVPFYFLFIICLFFLSNDVNVLSVSVVAELKINKRNNFSSASHMICDTVTLNYDRNKPKFLKLSHSNGNAQRCIPCRELIPPKRGDLVIPLNYIWARLQFGRPGEFEVDLHCHYSVVILHVKIPLPGQIYLF